MTGAQGIQGVEGETGVHGRPGPRSGRPGLQAGRARCSSGPVWSSMGADRCAWVPVGPQGAQGVQGETGPPGRRAQGTQGTGPAGPAGARVRARPRRCAGPAGPTGRPRRDRRSGCARSRRSCWAPGAVPRPRRATPEPSARLALKGEQGAIGPAGHAAHRRSPADHRRATAISRRRVRGACSSAAGTTRTGDDDPQRCHSTGNPRGGGFRTGLGDLGSYRLVRRDVSGTELPRPAGWAARCRRNSGSYGRAASRTGLTDQPQQAGSEGARFRHPRAERGSRVRPSRVRRHVTGRRRSATLSEWRQRGVASHSAATSNRL